MKKLLPAVLLLLLIIFSLDASETRLMLGGEFLLNWEEQEIRILPVLELTISTSPLLKGFQQEFGLRGETLIVAGWVDLVLRSWFLFPQVSSQFIRERFRFGIEYSPTLFLYAVGFFRASSVIQLLSGIETAICTSIYTMIPEILVILARIFMPLSPVVSKSHFDI